MRLWNVSRWAPAVALVLVACGQAAQEAAPPPAPAPVEAPMPAAGGPAAPPAAGSAPPEAFASPGDFEALDVEGELAEAAPEPSPAPPARDLPSRAATGYTAGADGCAAAGADAEFQCVELFFGANRGLSDQGRIIERDGPDAFGDARTFNTLFEDARDAEAPVDRGWYRSGRVVVTLPKAREPGDPIVPISARRRLREITEEERAQRFAPYSIELLEGDAFWGALEDSLAGADEDALLLYVHGFNVCFDSAAYRTAQLTHDLGFPGRAAFFSWPANCDGNFLDYGRDISLGQASEKDLERFIEDIKTKAHPSRLIVIAHSHGGSIVAAALRDAYGRTLSAGDIDVLVFAAADVDEEAFRRFAVDAADLYHSATLYASSRDFATGARRVLSELIGDINRRVGFFFGPAPATFPKVHTVDVSSGSLDIFGGDPRLLDYGPAELILNHATYAESPDVIADMRALIAAPIDDAGAPVEPHVRSAGAIDLVCFENRRFWRLASGAGAAAECVE